jgi:hypothetical protein
LGWVIVKKEGGVQYSRYAAFRDYDKGNRCQKSTDEMNYLISSVIRCLIVMSLSALNLK